MGGNAFRTILPSASFPRIPPEVYLALKARLTLSLQSLFNYVQTPTEAPEKLDYGDLDFTVASPVLGVSIEDSADGEVTVPHEIVREALGAEHIVPCPGYRTSNYAVPILPEEWEKAGHKELFEKYQKESPGNLYYQVDVQPCVDEAVADRTVFFNSYGDLGMIMGLLAANNGLRLSHNGLKMPNGIWKPVLLTEDMSAAMSFMGLDASIRARGFQTRAQIFEWIANARFFEMGFFHTQGEGISKVKEARAMYGDFLKWVENKVKEDGSAPKRMSDQVWEEHKAKRKEEALIHFGLKEEYDRGMRLIELRTKVKSLFNGHQVKEWISASDNNWKLVGQVMALARDNMGGSEGVMEVVDREGEEGIKREVHRALEALTSRFQGLEVT